jgi:hypothetical protein
MIAGCREEAEQKREMAGWMRPPPSEDSQLRETRTTVSRT